MHQTVEALSSVAIVGFDDNISTDKQFKCQHCSKDFDRYSHLARHIKIHSGIRPFECKYCHKSFSRSDNLIKHIRIHTGDKRYGCKFCLKRFTDSSNLTKHLRTHTGERRHRCPWCFKSFTESGTLRRHMLTHSITQETTLTTATSNTTTTPVVTSTSRHLQMHNYLRHIKEKRTFRNLQSHQSQQLLSLEATSDLNKSSIFNQKLLSPANNSGTLPPLLPDSINIGKTPYSGDPSKGSVNYHFSRRINNFSKTEFPFKQSKIKKRKNNRFSLDRLVSYSVPYNPKTSSGVTTNKLKYGYLLENQAENYSEGNFWRCSYCWKIFFSMISLESHLKRHLGIYSEKVQRPSAENIITEHTSTEMVGSNQYKCQHCHQVFTGPAMFAAHLKTHLRERLQCKNCENVFRSPVQLSRHRRLCQLNNLTKKCLTTGTVSNRMNSRSLGYIPKITLSCDQQKKTIESENSLSPSSLKNEIVLSDSETDTKEDTVNINSSSSVDKQSVVVVTLTDDDPVQQNETSEHSSSNAVVIDLATHDLLAERDLNRSLETEQLTYNHRDSVRICTDVSNLPQSPCELGSDSEVSCKKDQTKPRNDSSYCQEQTNNNQATKCKSLEVDSYENLNKIEILDGNKHISENLKNQHLLHIEDSSQISIKEHSQDAHATNEYHQIPSGVYATQNSDVLLENSYHLNRVYKNQSESVNKSLEFNKSFPPNIAPSNPMSMDHRLLRSDDHANSATEFGNMQTTLMKCHSCDKKFLTMLELTQHLKIHSHLACKHCQKTFLNTQDLRDHLKSHSMESLFHKRNLEEKSLKPDTPESTAAIATVSDTEKRHVCSYCKDTVFSSSKKLIQHMKQHHLVFVCKVCSKVFSKSTQLSRHLKIHAGIKPFQCTYCLKSFSRSDNLIKHVRIHTGDKRYGCKFCLKRFTDSSNLTKHMRTHTGCGQHQYRCKWCSKSFSESAALHRHLLTHNKQYPPTSLPTMLTPLLTVPQKKHGFKKPFHSGSAIFTQRFKNNLRDKLFRCRLCWKVFLNQSTLSKHISKHYSNTIKMSKSETSSRLTFSDPNPTKSAQIEEDSINNRSCINSLSDSNKFQQLSILEIPTLKLAPFETQTFQNNELFHCAKCENLFSDSTELIAHLKLHTTGQLYECKHCHKEESHYTAFNDHLKNCDGKNTADIDISKPSLTPDSQLQLSSHKTKHTFFNNPSNMEVPSNSDNTSQTQIIKKHFEAKDSQPYILNSQKSVLMAGIQQTQNRIVNSQDKPSLSKSIQIFLNSDKLSPVCSLDQDNSSMSEEPKKTTSDESSAVNVKQETQIPEFVKEEDSNLTADIFSWNNNLSQDEVLNGWQSNDGNKIRREEQVDRLLQTTCNDIVQNKNFYDFMSVQPNAIDDIGLLTNEVEPISDSQQSCTEDKEQTTTDVKPDIVFHSPQNLNATEDSEGNFNSDLRNMRLNLPPALYFDGEGQQLDKEELVSNNKSLNDSQQQELFFFDELEEFRNKSQMFSDNTSSDSQTDKDSKDSDSEHSSPNKQQLINSSNKFDDLNIISSSNGLAVEVNTDNMVKQEAMQTPDHSAEAFGHTYEKYNSTISKTHHDMSDQRFAITEPGFEQLSSRCQSNDIPHALPQGELTSTCDPTQNKTQFKDSTLDLVTSLSNDTLQLLLPKEERWCDEVLRVVTSSLKPTNDLDLTLYSHDTNSLISNQSNLKDSFYNYGIDQMISFDQLKNKIFLEPAVVANSTDADQSLTVCYSQHKLRNNNHLLLPTNGKSITSPSQLHLDTELRQEDGTSKENPNGNLCFSNLQNTDESLVAQKSLIKVEPGFEMSDCLGMAVDAGIKIEELSDFDINNGHHLSSTNCLPTFDDIQETLMGRMLSNGGQTLYNEQMTTANLFHHNESNYENAYSNKLDHTQKKSLPAVATSSNTMNDSIFSVSEGGAGLNPVALSATTIQPFLLSHNLSSSAIANNSVAITTESSSLQNDSNINNNNQITVESLKAAMGGGKHSVSGSLGKQYSCHQCFKVFARPSHLKRHLKVHAGLKPFACPYCQKWFSRSDNLTKHIRIHTGEKLFSCQYCQKRFSDSSNLTKHIRTHTGERPYSCRHCRQTFSESGTLGRHLRTHLEGGEHSLDSIINNNNQIGTFQN